MVLLKLVTVKTFFDSPFRHCYPAGMNTQDQRPYHHGDLRAALLVAAEAELAERGVEAFSLRSVAKRAGVSHAAPAHHFGDVAGLLTALAAEGHRRFLAAMERREAVAARDATSRLIAAGIGYIDFAVERPTLFRLIFNSNRLKKDDPELATASAATYGILVDLVKAQNGNEVDAAAAWAIAHGLADLVMSRRLEGIADLPPEARDAVLVSIIRRVMPDN
jgi:AcrR family transcriptional regulator